MDTFAHGLWSFAIFHKKKYVWLATLFGVLPDLLSFGIIFVINLLNGNLHRGPPALSSLPEWLFSAYNMTHSFVMFIFVFFCYFVSRQLRINCWNASFWTANLRLYCCFERKVLGTTGDGIVIDNFNFRHNYKPMAFISNKSTRPFRFDIGNFTHNF